MPRTRASEKIARSGSGVRARLGEECLELGPVTPADQSVLRRWIGRVNGSSYPQPFLVEGPPGRFRLYVGEAAERVRTERGIQ